MLYYILLCFIAIITGRGLLRVCVINIDTRLSWYLAPVATLSFWVVFLALGILDGFTVRQISVVLWGATLAFFIFGIPNKASLHELIDERWLIITVLFIPIALMASFFIYGIANYAGSPEQDGWSYVAQGAYLWHFVNGTEYGLAPLYQYATHLMNTRIMSGTLLAFLSPIVGSPGATQSVTNLYLSLLIFTFASACAFFSTIHKLEKLRLLYLIITVFSGWLLSMLYVNNFDNGLVLSFIPALAGLSYIISPKNLQWSIIPAFILSAVMFAYPEMAFVIFAVALLFFLQRLWNEPDNRKSWLGFLFVFLLLALMLMVQDLKHIVLYFWGQFQSLGSPAIMRPGEGFFPHLLKPLTFIAAYNGIYPSPLRPPTFGSHFLEILFWIFATLLSLGIFYAAILGAFRNFNKKFAAMVISVIILLIASLIMIFISHYSYGAYKFILLNWWAVCFLAVMGLGYLLQININGRQVKLIIGIYFVAYISVTGLYLFQNNYALPLKSLQAYRQVKDVQRIIGNSPLLISINDISAYNWALYFLRDSKIKLLTYRGYSAQPWVAQYMDRATPVNVDDVGYLLTDKPKGKQANILWQKGPYFLQRINPKYALHLELEAKKSLKNNQTPV